MLKTFTGYRGVAALVDIAGVQFVVIASNLEALEAIHKILPGAPVFDPAKCQKSVMIQSSLVPEAKP